MFAVFFFGYDCTMVVAEMFTQSLCGLAAVLMLARICLGWTYHFNCSFLLGYFHVIVYCRQENDYGANDRTNGDTDGISTKAPVDQLVIRVDSGGMFTRVGSEGPRAHRWN